MNLFKVEKLDLLVSLYIFCIAASEFAGAKTIPLFKVFGYQLNSSVAIITVPLVYAVNDILTEVYGKNRARSVVRSGLLVVLLIFVFSLIATSLPPSGRFIKSNPAYNTVFGLSARISAASFTAFAVAEFLDVFIFAKLRQSLGKKNLWLRTNASNFISQFVDTGLFMVLAFYAIDKPIGANISFLVSLIIPYWIIKCAASIIETPLVYAGVRFLKDK